MADTSLDSLIERVRAASGPDRELDEEIALACGLCWKKSPAFDNPRPGDPPYRLFVAGTDNCIYSPPQCTASLDSALALVERMLPEWWLESLHEQRTRIIYKGDRHAPLGKFYCALQHTNGGRLEAANATTLPLAVLAALLTALQQQEQSR